MEDQNNNQVPQSQPAAPINPPVEMPSQADEQPTAAYQPVQQAAQVSSPLLTPQPPQATPASEQQFQSTTPFQPFVSPVMPVAAEPGTGMGGKPKSKKKWLIALIALALLLLVGGGAASAYYFAVFQKPENVLLDALNKASLAKAVQSDTTVTLNKDLGSGAVMKDIKFKANSADNQTSLIDATVNMELQGKALSLGGKTVIALADNALYFKINNVTDAINAIMESQDAAGEIPTAYLDIIAAIEDQWVKVTVDDIKKNSDTAGSELECTINVMKKQNADSNKAVATLYKNNPFIVVKESLGVKNNQLGYKLNIDETKAKEFGKSLEETQAFKDMKACSPSEDVLPDDLSTVDSAITDNTAYTVWIDQWSHELKSIQFTGESGSGSDKTKYDGTVNIAYDPNAKVEIPTGVISFDEFMERLQEAFEPMVSGVQASAQTAATKTTAYTVLKKAEAYNAISDGYPKTLADFSKYPETSLSSLAGTSVAVSEKFPVDGTTVGFKWCSADKGQIVYYDATENAFMALGFGGGPAGKVKAFCSTASA